MRIARFLHKNKKFWGVVEKENVKIIEGSPFDRIEILKQSIPVSKIKLLPPSIPSKIILAGLNYKDHAKELGIQLPEEPIIFLKPPSSLIAHEDNIVYPQCVTRLDYEGELALVIKKEGRNIPEDRVDDYVLGYTCLNDVTARDLQKKDVQWTRAKSFDTFCPVGPWIETSLDVSNVKIKTYINSNVKQDSVTSNFIFSINYLVSFI